jgi:hypothetical protein
MQMIQPGNLALVTPAQCLGIIDRFRGGLGSSTEISDVAARLEVLTRHTGVLPETGLIDTPSARSTFHHIREQIRGDLGIPLLHQKDVFNPDAKQGSSSVFSRLWSVLMEDPQVARAFEQDKVVDEAAVDQMTGDDLDALIGKVKEPFNYVPDVGLEFLLRRFEVELERAQGAPDGVVQTVFSSHKLLGGLLYVLDKDPLRFTSRRGVRFLLHATQTGKIDCGDLLEKVLTFSENDIRVMPILHQFLQHEENIKNIRPDHVPKLMKVFANYPNLLQDLEGLRHYQHILKEAFESGFDKLGVIRPGMRVALNAVWINIGHENQTLYRAEWSQKANQRGVVEAWQYYGMLRFTSGCQRCAVHTEQRPELLTHLEWGDYSTPVLVDLFLHLRTSTDEKVQEQVCRLEYYLTTKRIADFSTRIGLFVDSKAEIRDELARIIRAVRAYHSHDSESLLA